MKIRKVGDGERAKNTIVILWDYMVYDIISRYVYSGKMTNPVKKLAHIYIDVFRNT